jgi:hypothetical protein
VFDFLNAERLSTALPNHSKNFSGYCSRLHVNLVSPLHKLAGLFFHALFQRLFLGDPLLKRVFLNSFNPLL